MMWLSGLGVASVGLWLVGLGVAMVSSRPRVETFLAAFASSARAHYIEQGLRLIAGGAFVHHAPAMRWSPIFLVFGWTLVVTTLCLFVAPWRWHRDFARWAVPFALRHLFFVAVAATGLGVLIIYGLL